MKTQTHTDHLSTFRHMLEDFQNDLNEINGRYDEFSEDHPEYPTQEEEEEIREPMALLSYALDYVEKVKAPVLDADYSSVSEAIYIEFGTSGGSRVKVRFATHSSNYDKDINIQFDSFLGKYVDDSDVKNFQEVCAEMDEEE